MDWGSIILAAVSALGGSGITQVFNWRLNKKKAKEEVKATEIDNMRKAMVEFYQPLLDDQNRHIETLKVRIADQDTRIQQQSREISNLHKQISDIYKMIGGSISNIALANTARKKIAKKKEVTSDNNA